MTDNQTVLTTAWKKGELPEGYYFIRFGSSPQFVDYYMRQADFWATYQAKISENPKNFQIIASCRDQHEKN